MRHDEDISQERLHRRCTRRNKLLIMGQVEDIAHDDLQYDISTRPRTSIYHK